MTSSTLTSRVASSTDARALPAADTTSFLGALAVVPRAYAEWRRHARDLDTLNQMSDRELADIGLTRADVIDGRIGR